MGFKLISKNNVGGVATLLLIILLSHSRFFDFLIDTALGRAVLILFILGISYTNKILGVVAVLLIIIASSNSNANYMESFSNNLEQPASFSPNNPDPKKQEPKKESESGIEGFNITEREDTMLRGKRSNEVQVFSNARNQDDDVEPSDKSVFTNSFSSV